MSQSNNKKFARNEINQSLYFPIITGPPYLTVCRLTMGISGVFCWDGDQHTMSRRPSQQQTTVIPARSKKKKQ